MVNSEYTSVPVNGNPTNHSPTTFSSWLDRNIMGLITDVFLVIVQISFIIYGILVLLEDGKSAEMGTRGAYLIRASKIGPTLFPIIFAATAARCYKIIGGWLLQRRGVSIGVLSQLIGSQSISSAFIAQIKMRALSIVGLVTIVLWAQSPLGSQASVRVIDSVVKTFYSTKTLQYLDTFVGYDLDTISTLLMLIISTQYPAISSLVASHLMATRNQDMWGNIRMPSIERLESLHEASDDGWHSIEETDSLTYSSMVGTPVYGISSYGNTTSVISGSYLSMKCDDIQSVANSQDSEGNAIFRNMTNPTNGDDCCWNMVDLNLRTKMWISGNKTTIANIQFNANKTRSQRQLFWQSVSGNGMLSYTQCNLFTSYVDTNITCTQSQTNSTSGSVCQATHARRTLSEKHIDSNWTAIDLTYQSSLSAGMFEIMNNMFQILDETNSGELGSDLNNPLVLWMTSPDTAFTSYMNSSALAGDISNVTAQTFEIRLSQVLNSFMTIGINPTAFSGSSYAVSTKSDVRSYLNTTGYIGVNGSYVRCDHTWLMILFVSAAIALGCAVASIVFRVLTDIPDVLEPLGFMFARSEIPAVSGQSIWDTSEWVKKNKDVKLVIGDIAAHKDVGRIGIASLPPKIEESLGPIEKNTGRLYE